MTVRETYKDYKKESKNPVSITTYTKVINAYMKFLMNHVFAGESVHLPSKFGAIKIIGREQKITIDEDGNVHGLTPNWRRTKELWDSDPEAKENKKLVYNTNENTNGVIYKFKWYKDLCTLRYKTIFSLIMTRENKRTLHKLVSVEQKEY